MFAVWIKYEVCLREERVIFVEVFRLPMNSHLYRNEKQKLCKNDMLTKFT